MYFLCKQSNKNNDAQKMKTQERRKLAKLSFVVDSEADKSITKSIQTNEIQNLFAPIDISEIFEPFNTTKKQNEMEKKSTKRRREATLKEKKKYAKNQRKQS